MTADELRTLIDQAGLSRVADLIIELSQPCLRFKTEPCAECKFPLGAFRVGGRPDLRAGMEWPQGPGWGQLAKRSLRFMAQFDLAELARFPACADLPPRGLLSFFYGVENDLTWGGPHEQGRWRVIHNQFSGDLARSEFPPDIEYRYSPCKPIFHETLSLPDSETLQIDRLRESMDDAEKDRYRNFAYKFESNEAEFPYGQQLMGIPQPLQGLMETECQWASHGVTHDHDRAKELERGAAEWRLLLQLEGFDENSKIFICADARVYIWIRNSNLRERRFDKAWVILQSM